MKTMQTTYCRRRRSQGGQRGHGPFKRLENIVTLRFERRFSQQNRVIRLNSNIWAPPNFWAGYATDCKRFDNSCYHHQCFAN